MPVNLHLGGGSTATEGIRRFPVIENNYVENPFFDEDTHYPHSQYLRNPSDWYNGTTDSGTNVGVKTPAHWRLFSPLYTVAPPTDYRTARGLSFQRDWISGSTEVHRFDTNENDDDAENWDFSQVYPDLAEIAAPTRPSINTDYETYNPDDYKRVLKLFGIGSELISYNANNTARTFNAANADSPVMSVCEDLTAVPAFPSDKCWVKYEVWSDAITPPEDAWYVRYGAYVRCPSHDMFRDDNFGGIYIQRLDRQSSIEDNAQTDFIAFHKEGNQPNLFTGNIGVTETITIGGGGQAQKAQYYWGGLASDQSTTGYNVNSFLQLNSISGEYKNAEDYKFFKKVERQGDIAVSPEGVKINIGLYFCENQTNLDESTTPTGAIEIYQPFVHFYDINGDIITN